MILNDTLIRSAKGKARPYKLPRELGLFVLVNPNGSKWWRFTYTFGGKEKMLSLGTYPDVPLKLARERRDEARCLVADGCDPSAHRRSLRERKELEAEQTFQRIGNEWLNHVAGSVTPVTLKKARWMLETFAYPVIGQRPIAQIEPPEVLKALRTLERRGKLETAYRLRARISQVIRFAIADGRATTDPCRDLRGAMKPKGRVRHHAALTDPKAVGELMRAIDGYIGTPETTAALKLAPLLFVRPGELRAAQWPQFDLDAVAPVWRFTATKTGTDHIVPLCEQAVSLLRELHRLTGRQRPGNKHLPHYLFPSVRTRGRPMSENTINGALRRLGYTTDQMTGHGFRAMARTLLAETGRRPDAIERQLAHKASGPLGAAYGGAQYLDERRNLMHAWADYLDALRRGTVVQGAFSRAA